MQIRLHLDFPFIIELPIAAARTRRDCDALVPEAAVPCSAVSVRTATGRAPAASNFGRRSPAAPASRCEADNEAVAQQRKRQQGRHCGDVDPLRAVKDYRHFAAPELEVYAWQTMCPVILGVAAERRYSTGH
jgi:hypothetical protein